MGGDVAVLGRPKAELVLSDEPRPGAPRTISDDKKVIGSLEERHRAAELKRFLVQIDPDRPRSTQIDERVPADLKVHLVLDSYATHKIPEIKRRLERHPRFQLHVTSTLVWRCDDASGPTPAHRTAAGEPRQPGSWA
jgi:hypothetical protein